MYAHTMKGCDICRLFLRSVSHFSKSSPTTATTFFTVRATGGIGLGVPSMALTGLPCSSVSSAKLVDRISQFGVLGHVATGDNRPEGLRLQRRRLGIEIREVERDIEGTAKRLP
jgi:hypothetical protein